MNYSIWDNLEKSIEEATASHENESLTARSTLYPTGTPPENKSPQKPSESHIEPVFNEAEIWQGKEELIASAPEEHRIPLKLGIIEEYILQGLRTGADRAALFLAAILGVALANNDRYFYTEVRKAIEK